MTNVGKHWVVKWTCKEIIVLKHSLYCGNNLEEYWIHEMTGSSTNCWCLLLLTITFKTYLKGTSFSASWDNAFVFSFYARRAEFGPQNPHMHMNIHVCFFPSLFLLKKNIFIKYILIIFPHPAHSASPPPHLPNYIFL